MRSLGIALLFAAAAKLWAVTYVVPRDREMIQRAEEIVVATAVTSSVERTARGGIVTRYVLAVDEVLKGSRRRGSHLVLTETGGELPEIGLHVSGMPVYVPGERYLVFTDANADGDPVTWGLGLGQFLLQDELALRAVSGFDENLEPLDEEPARDARAFVEYIRGIVAQHVDPAPRYFVAPQSPGVVTTGGFTRVSYLTTGAPRWRSAVSVPLVTSGSQPGVDGVDAVSVAVSQWNSTNSSIGYVYSGQVVAADGGFQEFDGYNAVLFNDPNGEVASPILARGGYWTENTKYMVDGETFTQIDGIDIVVDNRLFNQACLTTVLTHEMGHTLGFRHSNENGGLAPAPPCNAATQDCTSNAIMNSGVDCSSSSNPVLRAWDRTAAATVYALECTRPAVTATSAPQSKAKGETVTLTVIATGSPRLHYQWYEGAQGETTHPVGTDSAQFTSEPLNETTRFWVHVTNACGTASSTAIPVEVRKPRFRAVRH